jgi:putative transposase
MSRQARVVVEGVPHHVTQRGNNRQDIFLADEDRHFYLKTLREKSEQFGLTISGYRLMTNHVHLIAIPRHPHSLAKALGQSHWRYAMRFNRLHRRSGHCGRTASTPVLAIQFGTDCKPAEAG